MAESRRNSHRGAPCAGLLSLRRRDSSYTETLSLGRLLPPTPPPDKPPCPCSETYPLFPLFPGTTDPRTLCSYPLCYHHSFSSQSSHQVTSLSLKGLQRVPTLLGAPPLGFFELQGHPPVPNLLACLFPYYISWSNTRCYLSFLQPGFVPASLY